MTENVDKWPSKHRKTEKSGYRKAMDGKPLQRRRNLGNITMDLKAIWEMSASALLFHRDQ